MSEFSEEIEALLARREQLAQQISVIDSAVQILRSGSRTGSLLPTRPTRDVPKKRVRVVDAVTREKIAAAQRARWKRARQQSPEGVAFPPQAEITHTTQEEPPQITIPTIGESQAGEIQAEQTNIEGAAAEAPLPIYGGSLSEPQPPKAILRPPSKRKVQYYR